MTEAQTKLVLEHRWYAQWFARRCLSPHRGHTLEELTAAAEDGLMAAARKFDPTRGVKFTTYANRWVRAYIRRFLHYNTSVVHTNERKTMRAGQFVTRNDVGYEEDDFGTPPPSMEEWLDNKRAIAAGFAALDARERSIMADDRDLGAISVDYGVSRQRIQQIRVNAVARMRHAAWSEGLLEAPEFDVKDREARRVARGIAVRLNGKPISARAFSRELGCTQGTVAAILHRLERSGHAARTEKGWVRT